MAEVGSAARLASSVPIAARQPEVTVGPRHSAMVRVTHWIVTLCFLALLVTGIEILISHPRFYWGETGSVNTTPLFKIRLLRQGPWCRQDIACCRTRTGGAALSTFKLHGS